MDAGEAEVVESSDRFDSDDQLIIDVLVNARGHMGWRHRVQMAEALGVDSSTYNRWEEGTRRVPARILPKLMRVTGLTPSKLFEKPEGDEHPRPEYLARMGRMEKQIEELTVFVQRELERRRRGNNSEAAGN